MHPPVSSAVELVIHSYSPVPGEQSPASMTTGLLCARLQALGISQAYRSRMLLFSIVFFDQSSALDSSPVMNLPSERRLSSTARASARPLSKYRENSETASLSPSCK